MQRLFAILVLGFLALGIAGFSAPSAEAGAARCLPTAADTAAATLDTLEAMALPAAQSEGPAARRANPAEGQQMACNSSCARACSQRFGGCQTRECRQQYNNCVRACGC